jgi:hypothetical protein
MLPFFFYTIFCVSILSLSFIIIDIALRRAEKKLKIALMNIACYLPKIRQNFCLSQRAKKQLDFSNEIIHLQFQT